MEKNIGWRPEEGWENPCQGASEKCNKAYPQGIPKGYHILQDAGYEEGYEAGADTMHQADIKWLEERKYQFSKGEGLYIMPKDWEAFKRKDKK